MRLFKRTKRTEHKPNLRERRAAARTAKAEQKLLETEQKIHELADQARDELKGRA
ncbi:MAG: hypothetical protein ABIS86_21030 [Streptosporangiaceae bacterium]